MDPLKGSIQLSKSIINGIILVVPYLLLGGESGSGKSRVLMDWFINLGE